METEERNANHVRNQAQQLLQTGEVSKLAELVNNLGKGTDADETARNKHEAARSIIDVKKNLRLLQRVADGVTTITSHRLRAVQILLSKALPDLKSYDVQATVTSRQESLFVFQMKMDDGTVIGTASRGTTIEHQPEEPAKPAFLAPPRENS